jgi:tetratricopeptide (TPR) repeat protein
MNKAVENSIIRIVNEDKSIIAGAGFLVSPRYALTCAHVVAKATPADARSKDKPANEIHFDFPIVAMENWMTGRVKEWKEIYSDEGKQPNSDEDIAVIEVTDRLPHGCIHAPPVKSNYPKELKVHSFGFPINGDKGTPVSGIVKGAIGGGCVVIEDLKPYGQFINDGFSGGPVWVEDGNNKSVIGMVVSVDEVKRSAYIIPTSALIELLHAKVPHRIPHRLNRHFIRRDKLIKKIRRVLESEGAVALTGLGGMGKTQLAIHYAHSHIDQYNSNEIMWVNAEEATTLMSDYARLANQLDLREKDEIDQRVMVDAVWRWLETHEGWLLIFDNVTEPEQLDGYLTSNQTGHTIITSVHQDWSAVAPSLPLKKLDRSASIRFLLNRTKQSDKTAAQMLAEELGDLPLALEQAGAYISRVRGTTIEQYVKLYRTRREKLMKENKPPIGYRATVATTWEMSFQKVEEGSPAAAALLSLLAFVGPNDIPRSMVCKGGRHLPTVLAEAVEDELELGYAIEALLHYSLIESYEETWDVHRLVQAVMHDRMSEDERKRWAEAAARVVNDAFPSSIDTNMQAWPMCEQLLQHALSSATHAETLQVASDMAARLFNQAGMYMLGQAQFSKAKEAFERTLKIDEKSYGQYHPNVAIRVNNLGLALQGLGEHQKARKCFERALKIDETKYGPNHPNVAIRVNNLGMVLKDLDEYEMARKCFERALEIDKTKYGPKHPNVAIRINNLGGVLKDLEKYEDARECFEQALEIDTTYYGDDHPNVAIRVNNLGLALQDLNEYKKARECFERALRIDEKAYGIDHPKVAIRINNIGMLLKDLGEYEKARKNFERVLEIDEKFYGPDHPNVARDLNNLGLTMQELSKYEEARKCFERALKINEAIYGTDHPNVAIRVNNLGGVLKDLGEHKKARECFERALTIDKAKYGQYHPIVARDINNLGLALQDLGSCEEARGCFVQALEIDESHYGTDHPNVARDLNNLGMVLKDLGEYEKARECLERALHIDLRLLGEEHPKTKLIRDNLNSIP